MINILMHAPLPGAGNNPLYINGRVYSTAVGTPIQMPEQDAAVAGANGWLPASARAVGVGATATRPTNPKRGDTFEDTTLALSVMYDGATWRNRSNGTSV